MKWTSTLPVLLGMTIAGCCNCDVIPDTPAESEVNLSDLPVPRGADLETECNFIKKEIAEAESFADRMHESRYAVYYQAKSRQRISDLKARSIKIACQQ